MVSITRTPVPSNGPRPMNPLRDWGSVAQLMRIAFQSEVTAASLPFLPNWPLLRPFNSLLSILEALGMEAPEQMLGYVWEESGRIVGNATIGLSNSAAGIWLLSNVAVHPAYRRRGIARALVEIALKATQQHGGKYMTLQVQSDNFGARQLYENMGFRSLEQTCEFIGSHVQGTKPATSTLQLSTPTSQQWAAVQSQVAAHLPSALRTYRHSIAGLFQLSYQRSLLAKIAELLRGVQQANWCLLRDDAAPLRGEVLGGVVMQVQLSWGHHRVGIFVSPSVRGQVEDLILAQVAQQIQRYASRRISFILPASYVEMCQLLRRCDLREVRTLELMALQL